MFAEDLFLDSIKETKELIRERIANTAEGTFEAERREGYAECALELGEKIELMTPNDKEGLRLQCLNRLREKKKHIVSLWESMIDRTASFQIRFEITLRLVFFIALLCFLFSAYTVAAILGIITAILFIISVVPGLFQTVMFIMTGAMFTSDRLLVAYHEYGRIEAALFFSDYRKIVHLGEMQETWIYTTSHKNPPPE